MRYNTHFKDNNFLTPTLYTQELSEYVQNLKYEDLPEEVIERAKMILLQTVGAVLAAKDTSIAHKVCKMALDANNGNGGPVTVWGTEKKMSSINASLVLGTLADVLEWEDSAWTGHPSASAIPCAWIAAEERHKSGKELITAIVAAYEVYQRIAMAVYPSDTRWQEKGFGITNWQTFAAIIPICKLYGLDTRKINQAIGLACEQSTIPTNFSLETRSDFYHYEYGYRARDGFLMAKSVERGINNNLDGLDVPRCYTGIMCGDGATKSSVGEKQAKVDDEADLTWLTRDLGKRYLILESALRRWPASMWAQAPIEIVSKLAKEHGFGPAEIEEIVIDPATEGCMEVPDDGCFSLTQAQYSIPYVIAAMLHVSRPGDWYSSENLNDPEIIALARRVKAGASQEETVMGSLKAFQKGEVSAKTVSVKLKDGRVLVDTMNYCPGYLTGMMSREELVENFRIQSGAALSTQQLEKAIEVLCNIETVKDVATISDMLQ